MTNTSDLALIDIKHLRDWLRESFLNYYQETKLLIISKKNRSNYIKALTIQCLAKTLALKCLQNKANNLKEDLLYDAEGKQPFILQLMDKDLSVLSLEGAAAVWLTCDFWRIHLDDSVDVDIKTEDYNYGLVLQEFQAISLTCLFIREATLVEEDRLPLVLLERFILSEEDLKYAETTATELADSVYKRLLKKTYSI